MTADVTDPARVASEYASEHALAWMLYHVADVGRALAELDPVVGPAGVLVATTNGPGHLRELSDLVGVPPRVRSFGGDDAEELLRRHFARVDRRDVDGWSELPDRAAVAAADACWGEALPPDVDGPLRVRRSSVVLVAEGAR